MTFAEEKEQPSEDGNPFCSVRQLLSIGEAVGKLATSIETHGIYTWDRFGRYRKYSIGTVEVKRCLDLLANEFDLMMSGLNATKLDEDLEDPLEEFGWAAGVLPVEQAGSMSSEDFVPPASRERERTTLLLIISAMVNEAGLPERTAASAIARYTDKNGASVTDETVRKFLRLAEEARKRKLP